MKWWDKNIAIALAIGRIGDPNKHLYWTNVPGAGWTPKMELKFHVEWNWIMTAIEILADREGIAVLPFMQDLQTYCTNPQRIDSVSDLFNAVYTYVKYKDTYDKIKK
jgi:hypothetical protein